MILEGTTSSGAVVPVQVTDQGRVVAEGLQGPTGPQGPEGPAGPPGPAGGGLFSAYALIRDEKPTGTDGGSSFSGTWMTRELTAITADRDGITSISNDQFTLQAGSYLISWSAPAVNANRSQTRLFDASSTTVIAYGTNQFFTTTTNNTAFSSGLARVTISGATSFEIQHQVQANKATTGLGMATSFGGTEVYTQVEIYKES